MFEHALFDVPRREHGYCVDDVARALVVLVREPDPAPELVDADEDVSALPRQAAVDADGRVHNRMAAGGGWTDEPALGDWWGRAVQALGAAAVRAPTEQLRSRALAAFHRAASVRSPHGRAMAFATLGAAEVLAAHPARSRRSCAGARRGRVDRDHRATTRGRGRSRASATPTPCFPRRCWPAASATDNPRIVGRGLAMLRFLVDVETAPTATSRSPAPADAAPRRRSAQFDQQPIEVAAIADASARAFEITDDRVWRDVVATAWAWFTGDNDASTPMFDPGIRRRIRRTGRRTAATRTAGRSRRSRR